MSNFLKRNRIIFILSIILILGCCFFGYSVYNNNLIKNGVSNNKNAVSKDYKAFQNEKNRDKKIDCLKLMINEFDDYSKLKNVYKEVSDEYISKIELMKKYFIDEYSNTVISNTLKDVEKIERKDGLNKAKENLNNLLKTIENELDIVCTVDELNSYEDAINSLIKSYDNQLNLISEKEKAAEEAKRETEKQTQAKETGKTNSNTGNSAGNGSSAKPSKPNTGNSNSGSNSGGESKPSKPSGGNSDYPSGLKNWSSDGRHWDRSYHSGPDSNHLGWKNGGLTTFSCNHNGMAWDTDGDYWNYLEASEG